MSFQDELKADYQEKQKHTYDMIQIENKAVKILEDVKAVMLSKVKRGDVIKKAFGKKIVFVDEKISWFYFMGCRRVYDRKEGKILYKVLLEKCFDENIKLEKFDENGGYCLRFSFKF